MDPVANYIHAMCMYVQAVGEVVRRQGLLKKYQGTRHVRVIGRQLKRSMTLMGYALSQYRVAKQMLTVRNDTLPALDVINRMWE